MRPDGVVSYAMRQGDKRGGGELDFSDHTYDGHTEDGRLSGGLGQLTDGQVGSTQFRLDLQLIGRRGFEWVAWKNDSAAAEPVEIVFRSGSDLPRGLNPPHFGFQPPHFAWKKISGGVEFRSPHFDHSNLDDCMTL